MKTTLWTIMLLCAINNISAQVKSQVKESFELTSNYQYRLYNQG